jgi:hypothetical protein
MLSIAVGIKVLMVGCHAIRPDRLTALVIMVMISVPLTTPVVTVPKEPNVSC